MNKIAMLMAAGFATAASAQWVEMGDAGDILSGFQTPAGAGMLTSIDGSMDWFTDGDHVDAYLIKVTDPALFFASTQPGDGGSFIDDGGSEDDSRLFLFNTDGTLVMANDDGPEGSLESFISDPSTFAGGLTNSPGSVVAGGQYIVAITYFDNAALDVGGFELATFSPFGDLHGVNPDSDGALDSRGNLGDFDDAWTYRITLGGAMFVPTPASASLLALGGLAAARRRR